MNACVLAQTKPASKSAIPPVCNDLLQGRSEKRESKTLQHNPSYSSGLINHFPEAPPIVHEVLNSPGQPLDAATRAFMEPRFGHDFTNVRVHTDARAAESARSVGALAYTVGQNVVFGESNYSPSTHTGRELLGHELTHTIQQRSVGARVSLDQPISVEPPDTSFERAADERTVKVGDRSGRIAPLQRIALQRQPAPLPEIEMPAEWAFAADKRKSTWRHYARSQGQADAARIRKRGKLITEDRNEVTAKLRFFEGDAREWYIREIRPALLEVTELEERRQREERQKEEQRREEERKNREGTAAYYKYTRESQLESAAAEHAKFRENVHNLTRNEIYSQWNAEKQNFIAVASSPDHALNKEQLLEIWRLYWGDQWKASQSSLFKIKDIKPEERFAAQNRAESQEELANFMLRSIVLAHEFLISAEAQGKHVTLDELNKAASDLETFHENMVAASAMILPGGGQRFGRPPGMKLPTTSPLAPPTPDLITPSRPAAEGSEGLTFPRPVDVTQGGPFPVRQLYDLRGNPIPHQEFGIPGVPGGPDRVFVVPGERGDDPKVYVVRGGREEWFKATNRTLEQQQKRGFIASEPGSDLLSVEELRGKRVLDLAAGTEGQTVRDLRKLGIDAQGMDIALSESARQTGYLERADIATTVPFKGQFDVAFELYGGLAYSLGEQTGAAFQNAISQIKPGGTLYLAPLAKNSRAALEPFVQELIKHGGSVKKTHFFGEDEIWRITLPAQSNAPAVNQ
jgi:hypothetical protein